MGKVTIKAPVTVYDASKGQYVAPGTDVELDEHEAASLIGRHGEFGGPSPQDPANTHTRMADTASIEALNANASINKGHGESSGTDLSKMSKTELEAEAVKRGVEVPAGSTKAEIIKLLEAKAD